MGRELGNSGAMGVDTANMKQERLAVSFETPKCSSHVRAAPPYLPKWSAYLPSPFLVGLQSEPIIVRILVVFHILKAEN